MGSRTREINSIKERKNHIVRAYAQLGKNNSSCFDALAFSYGTKNLAKIVAKLGLDQMRVSKSANENDFSMQVAIKMASQTFGAEFVQMELFSSNFLNDCGKLKQQVFVCVANKHRVDRKRKYDFESLLKLIDQNDILLLDVREREISSTMAQVLQSVDATIYKNQVLSLILRSTPTVATMGKKQTPIVMQELKVNNPAIYGKIIELQKSIAKNLFVYETSKEQLLLNDAIEEFGHNIYSMPIEIIRQNRQVVEQYKLRADKIETMMKNNNCVLQKLTFAENICESEKIF